MKLTYQKPEIELNEYKFADIMTDEDSGSGGLQERESWDTSHGNLVNNDDQYDPFD